MDPDQQQNEGNLTNRQHTQSDNIAQTEQISASNQSQDKGYNTSAIIGFVLIFLIPLVGFIICIIALKEIKRTGEKGRNLARAGVLIFIIENVLIVSEIIMVLIFNTSQGLQVRTKDTERTTDINILNTRYEVYRQESGYYPTYAVAADVANFPGIPDGALSDPDGRILQNGIVPAADSYDHGYYYQAIPTGCDNTITICVSYTLGSVMEYDDVRYMKNSLN